MHFNRKYICLRKHRVFAKWVTYGLERTAGINASNSIYKLWYGMLSSQHMLSLTQILECYLTYIHVQRELRQRHKVATK